MTAEINELQKKIAELNTFSTPELPYMLTVYYSDSDRHKDMDVLYREFCDTLRDTAAYNETPSLNQFMYFFNMLDANLDARRTLDSIREAQRCEQEALSSGDNKSATQYARLVVTHKNFLHELRKTILKYSNSGIDRDTPRKLDVTVSHLDLNSIHQQLRGNIVDVTPSKKGDKK